MRLRHRLLVVLATIVLAVLLVSGVLVSRQFRHHVEMSLERELRSASEVLAEYLKVRYRLLLSHCRAVAQSTMVHALVSTAGAPPATLQKTAEEMNQIVGTDLLVLTDSLGKVVAAFHEPRVAISDLSSERFVASALRQSPSSGMMVIEGAPYQVVVVPVNLGGTIYGALLLGYRVSDRLARDIGRMTGTDVAIFLGERLVAESLMSLILPPRDAPADITLAHRDALLAAVRGLPSAPHPAGSPPENPRLVVLDGEQHLVLRALVTEVGPGLSASYVVLRSLDKALVHAKELTRYLVVVALASLVVALLLAIYGAQAIVEPLKSLVATTRAVADGDLTQRVLVHRHDEIGDLSRAFDEMVIRLAARDYLENILRTMTDSLFVIGPDEGVLTVNESTVALLGWSREEIIGKPFRAIIAPTQGASSQILDQAREGTFRNREVRLCTRSGEGIPVSFSAAPMWSAEGSLVGVVAVARDLRELLGLQQELAHREKLASLGQLAAGLAHELRNPLAVIKFASAQIRKHTQPTPSARTDRVEQSFQDIGREVTRVLDLIEELLYFSRRPAVPEGGVDLAGLLADIGSEVQKRSDLGEVEVRIDTAPDLPSVRLAMDPLHRILMNLCLNAVQAMEGRGRLVLQAHLAIRDGNRCVRVSVADTGPGIPKDIRGRIFDPFFTTKRTGTGLGLFICNQAVLGMGGTLDVESEPGKGTTFHVWLRTHPERSSSSTRPTPGTSSI